MSPRVTTACHVMKPLKCLAAVCSNPFSLWRDVSSWRSSEWKRTNCYRRNAHSSSHIFPSKRKLSWVYKWKCLDSRISAYVFFTLLLDDRIMWSEKSLEKSFFFFFFHQELQWIFAFSLNLRCKMSLGFCPCWKKRSTVKILQSGKQISQCQLQTGHNWGLRRVQRVYHYVDIYRLVIKKVLLAKLI